MAEFVKGDVVVVPFPFSNLSHAKKRPALVILKLEGDDLILCQITSQTVKDGYTVPIGNGDFDSGGLKQSSNIRPNRIFTADSHILLYKIGSLNNNKVSLVIENIVKIIRK